MPSLAAPEASETTDGVAAAPARRRPRRDPRRAQPGSWRGVLWTLVVAGDFFLMSNPLVFVAGMDRALTMSVLLTGAALVITFPWVRAPRIAVPVPLFLGWLLLSYTWSIQPSFTMAAWAQTTIVAAVAAAVYANVTVRVLAAGFVFGGVAVTVASVYAFREQLPGAVAAPLDTLVMAGIGTNRNILAYTLTLSLCGVLAVVPCRAWSRAAWLAAVGVIGYGLVDVDSSTADLTTVVLGLTAVLMAGYGTVSRRFLRTTARRVAAVLTLAVAAVAACMLVTRTLGPDLLTFSDRTPLWSASIAVAQERPWGGFGYGAVWQHPWKPPLLNIVIGEIWDRSGVPLSHGHNSVVDLVVEVGVVGVLLMVAIMVTAALQAVRLTRMSGAGHEVDPARARFIVLCLVNLVMFGITEPMATIPLGWWALVLLTEPVRRNRARRRPSTRMFGAQAE